jgi:hypothetical protein
MTISTEEFEAATARAEQRLRDQPHIVRASYDDKLGRVILTLSSGAWFAFRPEDAQGLQGASIAQLRKIEITPSKFGIDFPLLDAQFDVGGLLLGQFGSRKWMAQCLGAAGGSVRSKAKSTAARANGKLGGRPRKTAIG